MSNRLKQWTSPLTLICLGIILFLPVTGCNETDSEEFTRGVQIAKAIDDGTLIQSLHINLRNGNNNIVNISETASLAVTATLENQQESDLSNQVNWQTSDANILNITSSGLITGVSPGSAIIRASLDFPNEVSTAVEITVSDTEVDLITITPIPASDYPPCVPLRASAEAIFVDDSRRNATEWVNWQVANNDGEIISTSATEIQLVLFSQQPTLLSASISELNKSNGITLSAELEPDLALTFLQASPSSIKEDDSKLLIATANYLVDNEEVSETVNEFLNWSTDSEQFASVDNQNAKGQVTAKSDDGNVVITAQCGDTPVSVSKNIAVLEYQEIIFVINDLQYGSDDDTRVELDLEENDEIEITAFADYGNTLENIEIDGDDFSVIQGEGVIAELDINGNKLLITPSSEGEITVKASFEPPSGNNSLRREEIVIELE